MVIVTAPFQGFFGFCVKKRNHIKRSRLTLKRFTFINLRKNVHTICIYWHFNGNNFRNNQYLAKSYKVGTICCQNMGIIFVYNTQKKLIL